MTNKTHYTKIDGVRVRIGSYLYNFYLGYHKANAAVLAASRKVRKRKPKPVASLHARAIKLASSQIGTKESPAGSNNVKYNTWYYGHPVNGANYSWCAVFVSWVLTHIGLADFKYAYVPAVVNDARDRKHGLTVVSVAAAKAAIAQGSVVVACYDWPGESKGLADHIGIVKRFLSDTEIEAIEGNTAVGNDSNGGEVMLRQRNVSLVLAFVLVQKPGPVAV